MIGEPLVALRPDPPCSWHAQRIPPFYLTKRYWVYTGGDDPLVAVFVCLAGPEQIADEAPTRGSLGNLPDYRDRTSKVEASTSALSETTPVAPVTVASTDSM